MVTAATPITIGSVTLRNRVTFAPTVKFDYADDTGMVSDAHIVHYTERAQGGCGLICVEATGVTPQGRIGNTNIGLWCDEQIPGHKAITDACHAAGAAVIVQLNHTGYSSTPGVGDPIGPSAVEQHRYGRDYITIPLTVDGIHEIQAAYIAAAVRAQKAGYDGVQLHGCHSYLINQFMSPTYNKRTDEYGGTTENRARFGAEIIEGIRKACGKDFLISVRTSGYDDTIEDGIAVAEEYVKAGCDYLQVSCGIVGLDDLPVYEEGISKIATIGILLHKHFAGRVPVSCVGGILTPEQVNYLIENELVDTVDLASAILADPGFAGAVVNGTEYVKCFRCRPCQYGPGTKHQCPAEKKRNQG